MELYFCNARQILVNIILIFDNVGRLILQGFMLEKLYSAEDILSILGISAESK